MHICQCCQGDKHSGNLVLVIRTLQCFTSLCYIVECFLMRNLFKTQLIPPQHLQCHLLAQMEPCMCSFSSSGFVSRAYLTDLFIQTDLRTDDSLFLTDPEFWAPLCTSSKSTNDFLSENTAGNRLLYLEKYFNRWQELFQGSAAHCITSLLHFGGLCVCVCGRHSQSPFTLKI